MIKSCRKQIHIGVTEHLEDGLLLIDPKPFCFERSVQSRKTVCQYVEFAWNMTNSDHDIVFQTPMEVLLWRLGECVPPCLLIYETTVVLSVEIITQEC